MALCLGSYKKNEDSTIRSYLVSNFGGQSTQWYDRQRGSASQRGYDSRWQKARKQYLIEHPLCVKCLKEGRLVTATVVDRIIPHKGNMTLFWDKSNWQALCNQCHDTKTAKEDGRWGK